MLNRRTCRTHFAVTLVLCLMLGAVPAFGQAQASTGQITGTVVDSQGAAISGATVKATSGDTGLQRTTTSSEGGLFSLLLLPPGAYTVSAEASGFQAATVSSVEVVVGRTANVTITLGVSGVQEVVNVAAGAIQIQTTRPEADAVLNERAIENLPINGRRFQDFITLTPGAQVEPRRQQISLSGQLGIHSNVNIDGADYNQPFFGGIRGGERSNNAFTVPQEAIKEFQVVSSGYSAEFGRSTGGIVNAVTKSGTNEYHGSAFWLYRPREWSADNNFIDAIELQLSNIPVAGGGIVLRDIDAAPTQHQLGGSIGGPIKTDKLFFFAAYEYQRNRQNREVFFDTLAGLVPVATSEEAFNFFRSLEQTYEQTNDAHGLLGRIDYEFNSNNRLNIRYSFSDNEAKNATSNGVPLFPTIQNALSNNGTEKDRTHTVVGQWASFFGHNLVNELRAQYSREERPRLSNANEPTVETNIGRFGTVSFLPTTQFDWRFQVADSLTYTRGAHTIKFGGEWNHVFVDQTFGFNQFGRFQFFSTTATTLDALSLGGTIANRFDSTTAVYFKQIGNLRADFSTDEFALFAQDSWRFRPNLTLNFGLRWEGQYNPDPQLGNTALIDLIKDFTFPTGHRLDPTKIADDTNNFGPRIGFAWDPLGDGKTVVRGFGGVYYSRTPLLLLAAPFNNFREPAGDLSVRLPLRPATGNPNAAANTVYKQLLLIGIDLNDFGLGSLPQISSEQIQQLAALLGVNPLVAGLQPIGMASDYQNPTSIQWGFGAEREVARGFTAGIDFAQVHTTHLQQNRELNIPLPIIRDNDRARRPFYGVTGAPFQSRPIPELGSIQVRESTGRSLYRAMTIRTKFQRNWGQFNAFYVLSKSLSHTDNEREAGGVQYEDALDMDREYGPSNLDTRHQFVINPIFFLPYGIDLAGAVRARSGRPIDARMGFDANRDGLNLDRPYQGPGIPFVRNSFRNRPVYNFDLRAQKRINIDESMSVTLSLEIFNFLNLENIELAGSTVTNFCGAPTPDNCGFFGPTNPNFLSTIERNSSNRRFGSLLLGNTSGDPLQMQFGIRFKF